MMVRVISTSARHCLSLRKASDPPTPPVAWARVACLFGIPCASVLGLLEESEPEADAHTEAPAEAEDPSTMMSSCIGGHGALEGAPLMFLMMSSETL